MKLSPETRARLGRHHHAAVGRAIAAEAIGLELMSGPIQQATERLVATVGIAGDRQRTRLSVYATVRSVSVWLMADFERATLETRHHARQLARGQVTEELAEVLAFQNQIRGVELVMPPITAFERTREQDEANARQAAFSMAQRWSSLALSAFVAWWRKDSPSSELLRGLNGVMALAEPAVRTHASVHAIDALNDEHRMQWRELATRV